MTDKKPASSIMARINWILVAVDLVAIAIYTMGATGRNHSHGPGMSGLGNALLGLYAVVLMMGILVYAIVFSVLKRRGWKRTTTFLFGLFVLFNLYGLLAAMVIALS